MTLSLPCGSESAALTAAHHAVQLFGENLDDVADLPRLALSVDAEYAATATQPTQTARL
jgi:hypothetical protein